MSGMTPRARSARAVPGPIAATVAFASARASKPALVHRLEQELDAVGAGQADQRVGVESLHHRRDLRRADPGLDPDGGKLDHIGAEVAKRRREAARLRARPRDHDAAAVEGPALQPLDPLAPGGDRPEQQDRRGADSLGSHGGGQGLRRRHHGALAGVRPSFDRGRGVGGVAAGGDQLLGDPRQVLHAHVEDERSGEGGERRPVDRRLGLLRVLVAGDEGDGARVVAVGDRDAGVGGSGDPGGDPGDDLEGDAGVAQRLRLLAAATEDERVAALQPDDRAALARDPHQLRLGIGLLHRDPPGGLADVDQLGVLACAGERAGGNQAVVEDRVGGGDQGEGPSRHQPGVAGSGADEVDDAGARGPARLGRGGVGRAGHAAHSSARASRSRAPASVMLSTSASARATGCSGSPATESST